MLGEHGVDHGGDGALLGPGETLDAFELLLEPGDRAALDGGWRGFHIDQRLDRDGQGAGETRQQRHRHAASADLVGGELGLLDAEPLGELDLG